jgi:hypothetical protein
VKSVGIHARSLSGNDQVRRPGWPHHLHGQPMGDYARPPLQRVYIRLDATHPMWQLEYIIVYWFGVHVTALDGIPPRG